MSRPGPQGGQYQPLNQDQIQEIHQASLDVLQNIGIQTENKQALSLFRRSGAQVNGNRIYISRSMVEDAVSQAPSVVLLAGRDPDQDVTLSDRRVYCRYRRLAYHDPRSWRRRSAARHTA